MPFQLRILALAYGILLFIIFLSLIRRHKVKPFYSALWLAVSIFMISFVVFEKAYKWIATQLGISDASFLVIVGLISFLFIYNMYLSVKISEMSDRIQELISHTSILEFDLRKLKESKSKQKESKSEKN